MNKIFTRYHIDSPSVKIRLDHHTDFNSIIARSWTHLGTYYVVKRYYLKAFLCFETALSLDFAAMNIDHYLVRRLILAGKLQEANEFATQISIPFKQDVKEFWAMA